MNTPRVEITVEQYDWSLTVPRPDYAPAKLWRWAIRRDGFLTESGTGCYTEAEARRFARGVFEGEYA